MIMINYNYLKTGLLSCLLLLAFSTVSAQFVDEPLFYYKFEDGSGEFATDSSANFEDASIVGNYDTTWTDGYNGGGFYFDGDTYMEIPSTGLNSNSGSFAAWIKGYDGRIRTIFSAGDNTTGGGFGGENEMHIHLEGAASGVWAGGEASFYQHNGGDRQFFIWSDPDKGLADPAVPPVNPTVFGDTVWRHLAVTWGGGNVKMYVNGALLADTTWTPTANGTAYNFTTLRLGTMLDGGNRKFHGVMDEVQAWDWILADADIMTVYSQVTGIEDLEKHDFQLKAYPNPAQDLLNVSFASSAGKVAEVSVMNTYGQTLSRENFVTSASSSRHTLDVSELASGVYLVQVTIDGQSSFQKVCIK